MSEVERIDTFKQLNVLSDPRRLSILRLLMAKPATISQLGRLLGEHPAWVRHHVKKLELIGLVELGSTQISGGYVEKYYRPKARAFILHEMILPESPETETLILIGSHDLALNKLTKRLRKKIDLNLLTLPMGSLDGLVALRQGIAHLSSCHLIDIDSGEYNLPYIRYFFPDRAVILVTLAHREQGLLVSPGNPHQIQGLEDLVKDEITFINRNQGSGTRLWLEKQLAKSGIPTESIPYHQQVAHTHTTVAEAVITGQADVGLGLKAAARESGLDFIPLFRERYDLIIPEELYQNHYFQTLLNELNGKVFRDIAASLGGYETAHSGDLIFPQDNFNHN
jgi:putative molybdopterin biosynthesis protein